MPLSGELYKYHFLPYHIVLDKVSDNFSCTSWYKVWREAEKYCAVALFTANRIQIDFWLHPFRYWLKFTVNLKIASIEAKKLYTVTPAKSPQGSVHIWKDKQFLCRNLEQNYSHYRLLSANLSKKINRYHLHIILNTVQTCYLVTIYLTQELGEMWGWRYKKCIQSLTKDPAAFLRITRIMWVTIF